jgi:hypothetical protein
MASGDTGSFVGMHCCLMIRRMVLIVYHRRVGVVIEDDVLSHGVHCFSNLYETGFAGFAARRAVR